MLCCGIGCFGVVGCGGGGGGGGWEDSEENPIGLPSWLYWFPARPFRQKSRTRIEALYISIGTIGSLWNLMKAVYKLHRGSIERIGLDEGCFPLTCT